MEYGSAYFRASRNSDEDAVSILSAAAAPSQYQPYRPVHHRGSSEFSVPNRASWAVSPVALQQSLPPIPPANEPSINMRPSIFGSRANLDSPYQEPVAWANSTHFRSTSAEGPKPEGQSTVFVIPEEGQEGPPRQTRQYFRHPRHIREPWKAGFWIRFPWWGFGALFVIVLLTGASAGILLASHNMTLEDWRVGDDNAQPHVYLSVFEMIMNFLILFALADGIVIRFWRRLARGTTLSSIHDMYDSRFLWPALKRVVRLRFNVVAVACLLTAISFVRGPLFQRALTVSEDSTSNTRGTLDLPIAPVPIIDYFQGSEADPRKQGGITSSFSNMLRDVSAGSPMAYDSPVTGCGDYCTGKIKGYAFKTDCSTSIQPFDLSSLPEECKACTTQACSIGCTSRAQNEFNPTFFSVNYRRNRQDLIITSIVKTESSCKGNIQVQTCALTQTTTDYPIVVTNGTIDRLASEPNTPTYDNEMTPNDLLMEKYWPLAFEILFPSVSVNVTPAQDYSRLQYNKCTRPVANAEIIGDGSALTSCSNGTSLQADLLARDPSVLYATRSSASAGEDLVCSLTWRDPMQDVIDKMQSLAFRITVDMAQSDGSVFAPTFTGAALEDMRKDWKQPVSISGYQKQPTYKTNRILVAFGVLVSVLGVAAIIPLYNGFWEMGRTVSLNPLEIARAFGAPLMEGLDGNATPDMISIERGGMAVRYGALERFGDEKKLRVEETARATVRVPWQGEIFG